MLVNIWNWSTFSVIVWLNVALNIYICWLRTVRTASLVCNFRAQQEQYPNLYYDLKLYRFVAVRTPCHPKVPRQKLIFCMWYQAESDFAKFTLVLLECACCLSKQNNSTDKTDIFPNGIARFLWIVVVGDKAHWIYADVQDVIVDYFAVCRQRISHHQLPFTGILNVSHAICLLMKKKSFRNQTNGLTKNIRS